MWNLISPSINSGPIVLAFCKNVFSLGVVNFPSVPNLFESFLFPRDTNCNFSYKLQPNIEIYENFLSSEFFFNVILFNFVNCERKVTSFSCHITEIQFKESSINYVMYLGDQDGIFQEFFMEEAWGEIWISHYGIYGQCQI